MHLDLVLHPRELSGRDLSGSCCVVIDVLRATTTMITALCNGANEIHVFSERDDAERQHERFEGEKLLAGESGCLPIDGFDLGNSPGAFTRDAVEGKTIFMCTTNGTRAVHACSEAKQTVVAALINASATARRLHEVGLDAIFVCAGVDGAPGGEDIDAAATIGGMLLELDPSITVSQPLAETLTYASWLLPKIDRTTRLSQSPGGLNLRRVGLDRDIDYASQLDGVDCVCTVVYSATDAIVRRLD